jgi:acyl-CoA thioesterase-1
MDFMREILSGKIKRTSLGLLWAVVVLLVTGCEGTQPEPAPAPPATVSAEREAQLTVTVLGDSLSAGLGLPEDQAFPAVLQDLLRAEGFDVQVLNAGVSGDTSAGGLSRVDWILRQKPQVLIVELGGNDALRGQPLEHTEDNLRAIIARGRAAGARVLLLGMDVPANYGPDYGQRFTQMYVRIAASENVDLVPGFVRVLAQDPDLLQPDGLHPTAEGQRRLAQTVLPFVRQLL